MIKYSEYRKIQDMKAEGVNRWQVSKRTGYSQSAVRKVWDMTDEEFFSSAKYSHDQHDEYKADIIKMLTAYPTIRNATVLDRLKEMYPDKEFVTSTFNRYMVKLRDREGFIKSGARVCVARAEQPPGYEAQVDLGEARVKDMYGKYVKLYFFCMVLSYSKMKFVYFSAEPFDTNRFIYAHEKAFKYFGGRPEIIMYDQDKLLLVSENAGKAIYTDLFDAHREKAGFKVFLCRKNDPNTKGRVESLVKYVKSNFLDCREYCGIDSLNSACLAWLDRTGNGTVDKITKKTPRDLFEMERLNLAEYKIQNIELCKQKIVSVSKLNTITYRKNRYDIPAGVYSSGARLRVDDDGRRLAIIDPITNKVVARHTLSSGTGEYIKKIEVLKPPNPIIAKVKKLFDDDPTIVSFVDEIYIDQPRYITHQCQLLKKIHTKYGKEESISAVTECVTRGESNVTDVLAVLTQRHGIKDIGEILPPRTRAHYAERANELNKYALLAEEN